VVIHTYIMLWQLVNVVRLLIPPSKEKRWFYMGWKFDDLKESAHGSNGSFRLIANDVVSEAIKTVPTLPTSYCKLSKWYFKIIASPQSSEICRKEMATTLDEIRFDCLRLRLLFWENSVFETMHHVVHVHIHDIMSIDVWDQP